jgi:hypothetical protein
LSFEKVFLIYERKLCLEETKDFKVLLLCASSASDKVEIITGHNKASSLLEALVRPQIQRLWRPSDTASSLGPFLEGYEW